STASSCAALFLRLRSAPLGLLLFPSRSQYTLLSFTTAMLTPPSLEELLASAVCVVVGRIVGSLVRWMVPFTGFGSWTYPSICTTSEKEGLVAGAFLATSSMDSSPPEPSVGDACVTVGVGVGLDDGGGNLRWRE